MEMTKKYRNKGNIIHTDNENIASNQLSLISKGLFCFLLQLTEKQPVKFKDIFNSSSDNPETIDLALRELVKFGYLRKVGKAKELIIKRIHHD